MQIAPQHSPYRRRQRETVLPMINISFLLLIFFLMMAQVETAPPFPVTPPEAADAAEPAAPERVLFVSAQGAFAHDGHEGEAALDALAAALAGAPGPVLIRADSALEAVALARLLAALGERGITDTRLAASEGGGRGP